MNEPAIDRAIRAAGSQAALGRLLGRTQSTISEWRRGLRKVPGDAAIIIERRLKVPARELRPDLFQELPPPGNGEGRAAE